MDDQMATTGVRGALNTQIGKLQTWWKRRQIERHFRPYVTRERALLLEERQKHESLYEDPEESPLVSVMIPTHNRGKLLVERTLPSVFGQTYRNYEIVIAGDCCTDDTEERVRRLNDPRIRFTNLPKRGRQPRQVKARWLISGSYAMNHAFRHVWGKWLAPLDDDDVFTPDHIESLLRLAQRGHHELAYGRLRLEERPGQWKTLGRPPLETRDCNNSASLYRTYLRAFEFSVDNWRIGWGEDVHRTWRLAQAGVRWGFLDQTVAFAPLRPAVTIYGHLAEDRDWYGQRCNCRKCRRARRGGTHQNVSVAARE